MRGKEARGDTKDSNKALTVTWSKDAEADVKLKQNEATSSSDSSTRWYDETKAQLTLSLPIIASNLLMVSMQMTDLGFIGRIGKEELAAAALGNTVFYLLHYPMIGAMTAVDTLLATAHGAKLPTPYGEYTQVGMVFVTVLCVPIGIIMLFVEGILLGIDQDAHLSYLAGRFCKHLTWSLFPYYWTQVLTKYLQAQHVLSPPVYVGLVANGANVFLNWLFIFELGMGFDGAPIATGACRWFQLFALTAYLLFSRVERNRPTRPKNGGFFLVSALWSGTASSNTGSKLGTGSTQGEDLPTQPILLRLKALSPNFLSLAGPGAFMMAVEAWAFEVTTLLAGYLGTVQLDAHLTMLQLATLAFLSLPFAVAIASTIRVGNLLGAGDALGAKDASRITFAICFAFTSICAVVFSLLRNSLGYVFTDDKEVVEAVSKIAPIAALFQLADGGQAAAGGVFRGMGRQTTVAVRNFFGFWVFGMPVGAVLTFFLNVGLSGLWWGLTVGLTMVVLVSLVQLVYVNWESEVENAHVRMAKEEEVAMKRVSMDWSSNSTSRRLAQKGAGNKDQV